MRADDVFSILEPMISAIKADFPELIAYIGAMREILLEESATIFVASTGSDETGDGSYDLPYQTLSHALNYNRPQKIMPKSITIKILDADAAYDGINMDGTEWQNRIITIINESQELPSIENILVEKNTVILSGNFEIRSGIDVGVGGKVVAQTLVFSGEYAVSAYNLGEVFIEKMLGEVTGSACYAYGATIRMEIRSITVGSVDEISGGGQVLITT